MEKQAPIMKSSFDGKVLYCSDHVMDFEIQA